MTPCARCGAPVPAGGRFCMQCGAPVVLSTPVPASASSSGTFPLTLPRSNSGVWWALGVVLVLAAVLVGLQAAGILRMGAGGNPKAVLTKPGEGGPPLLVAKGDSSEPVMAAKSDSPPSTMPLHRDGPLRMPDDVRAWLEHLERIEKAKQELQRDEMDELMISFRQIEGLVTSKAVEDLIDPEKTGDPAAGVNDFLPIEKMTSDWKDLRRRFLETGPPCPDECVPLRNAFDGALSQVPGSLNDINEIVGNLFDPEKKSKIKDLREVQKSHREFIDKPLKESDRMVQQICDRYDTKKWFDIKVDSGGILGVPGF